MRTAFYLAEGKAQLVAVVHEEDLFAQRPVTLLDDDGESERHFDNVESAVLDFFLGVVAQEPGQSLGHGNTRAGKREVRGHLVVADFYCARRIEHGHACFAKPLQNILVFVEIHDEVVLFKPAMQPLFPARGNGEKVVAQYVRLHAERGEFLAHSVGLIHRVLQTLIRVDENCTFNFLCHFRRPLRRRRRSRRRFPRRVPFFSREEPRARREDGCL